MSDKYILEIKTEHAQPIKTLFEVLKEVLEDANIELKRDDTIPLDAPNVDSDDDSDNESNDEDSDDDSESDDETDSESELKQKNKKATIPQKQNNDKESDDDESDDDDDTDDESDEDDDEDNESDDEEDEDDDDDEDEDDDEDDEKKDEKNKKDIEESKKRGYIRIMAVDPTRSIFIHLKLDSKNFTKFRCKHPKKIIGVNLVYLHKLIKSMDKDDNLTLFIKNNDDHSLWIKRYNSMRKKETLDHMNLIDLNKDKYKIPPTSFEAVVKMPSGEFHKVCREMSNIADYVEIQCINNKIIFKCKGEYAGRTVTYVHDQTKDSDSDSEYDNGKQNKGCVCIKHSPQDSNNPFIVREIYDLKNITLFTKFTSLCNAVQLYMKSEYPLVVKYTVATLGHILVCFTPVKAEEYKFDDEHKLYKDKAKEEYLE